MDLTVGCIGKGEVSQVLSRLASSIVTASAMNTVRSKSVSPVRVYGLRQALAKHCTVIAVRCRAYPLTILSIAKRWRNVNKKIRGRQRTVALSSSVLLRQRKLVAVWSSIVFVLPISLRQPTSATLPTRPAVWMGFGLVKHQQIALTL